ncbi:nucleotidyltransferase substrate binding protein [Nibrella saemangeumensis]|uniref:Nucleotidyltransferase substrate binding protein n=1 Tax=Nibrella saemangeumensis TaxID=1084526 RepID=A0ABP8MHD1_9BACT
MAYQLDKNVDNTDVRWIQRFTNYKKALAKLSSVVEKTKLDDLSELEKEGLIQRFEYTFELAWKTLQDLLNYKGYKDIAGPNPVLSQALQDGYITDAEQWRMMKKSRELTSHTYNSDTADGISENIFTSYV